MKICYHTTSSANADSILNGGFRDSPGVNLFGDAIEGVFLSAEPLIRDGLPDGTPLEKYQRILRIEFSDEFALDDFVYDDSPPPTWHLPAAAINEHATVTVWSDDEKDEGAAVNASCDGSQVS